MTTVASFQRLEELEDARHQPPGGLRLEAIRDAAPALKRTIAKSGTPLGVKTYDLITVPYPTKYALGGAALLPVPFIMMRNRMQIVQFDVGGETKTLLVNPTDYERSRTAPFYAKLAASMGPFSGKLMNASAHNTVEEALTDAGIRPEDVDYITFDHLHVQDVRRLLGTKDGSIPALLPNAILLVQREELQTFKCIHPFQRAWYVADGIAGIDANKIVPLMGDYLLGPGVAIVRTPGHTYGNHSIVLNTDGGMWTISENGVCVDNYAPHASKIAGVRRHARYYETEIILNSNSRDLSLEQYNSMVLEKMLADPVAARPEFPQHFSSSEMVSHPLAPRLSPTYSHGAITHGTVRRPVRKSDTAAA